MAWLTLSSLLRSFWCRLPSGLRSCDGGWNRLVVLKCSDRHFSASIGFGRDFSVGFWRGHMSRFCREGVAYFPP